MDEGKRQEALKRYQILDTPRERAFDDIAELAADIAQASFAFISFVDGTRAWFKAAVGIDLPYIDRKLSICDKALEANRPLMIEDLRKDPRFAQNAFVLGPPLVRSYAGAPICSSDGFPVGMLCVLDRQPRKLSPRQMEGLERLARHATLLLESGRAARLQGDSTKLIELFNAVAVAANDNSDPYVGIRSCVERFCAYTGAPIGHYWEIFEDRPDVLVSSGIWSFDQADKYDQLVALTAQGEFTRGKGVPGVAMETGKPSWRSDLTPMAWIPRAQHCLDLGFQSIFAFPVLLKDEVVGVFEFFLMRKFAPGPEMLGAMEHVATQISRVIERQRADAAVHKQKEFFDAVLENLGDGIVATDEKGALVLFNRASRELYGLDAHGDLPQSEWTKYYRLHLADGKTPMPPERIPLVRIFKGEVVKNEEMVVSRLDGQNRSILASGRQMQSKNGKPLGAVVALHDISEMKRAQALIENTTKTLQALIDTSPAGIVVMDVHSNITLWNPGCEKIYGWTVKEAVGHPLKSIPPEGQALYRLLLADIAKNGTRREFQADRIRKDGRLINVHVAMVPMYGEQGLLDGFLAVVLDITDLAQKERDLIAANRAKSEFLANMSHEIRTPLNGVIGMTELVLAAELGHEQRESIEIIQSSANNVLSIISDILDFSKIEAGKLDIENVSFAFAQILEDVHRTLEFSASRKGLRLSFEVAGEMPPRLAGDPNRIRQIMTNLVNNAIKFTKAGEVRTKVTLTKSSDARVDLRVEVVDTGIGISADVMSRLFQAFSQADSSTTRKFGGTGLGLSISKRLIDLMNGEIGAVSEVGRGSRFWFTLSLPLGRESTQSLRAAADAAGAIDIRSVRVLVAEDNPTNTIITMRMLSNLGLAADAVENGRQAVDALQIKKYDLVLMDCQMPEMDGYEASAAIRADANAAIKGVAIIAMTANAMKGDREKCLAAGMNDYVSKPVKVDDLQAAILRNLAARRAA